MNRNHCLPLCFCLLLSACLTLQKAPATRPSAQALAIATDSLILFDQARNRSVPVALYLPKTPPKNTRQKVVIFSHGYGENQPGANKGYTYLTSALAAQGYFVASIQHELPTDSLLPMTGKPQITRRSNWERGAANILFVLNELKRLKPGLAYSHLILIGHSNGGDMTMLFAHKYPQFVDKAISLDNRRMALPRTKHPKIYSLRADDDPADEGVLPTSEEQQRYGIKVVHLPNVKHGEMSSYGTEEQHQVINKHVLGFIKE